MFNDSIKNEFIQYRLAQSDKPFSPHYLNNWFDKSSYMENKLNKDLCNFNIEEILNFYKSVGSTSYLTLRTLNSQLRIYTEWCMNKGLVNDIQNHFEEISKDDIWNCVNLRKKGKSIISREDIERWCDYDIINPRDQFVFLCIFEGVKGKDFEEIVNLTYKDLSCEIAGNSKHYYFELNGEAKRKIEVSAKLYYTALTAFDTIEYTQLGSIQKVVKLKDRGQYIFKGYMNQDMEGTSSHQKGKVIYTLVKRNLDHIKNIIAMDLGFDAASIINPRSIHLSGIIHFIQVNALKYNLTPIEYVQNDEHRAEIEHQFGININRTYFIDRNKDLLQ